MSGPEPAPSGPEPVLARPEPVLSEPEPVLMLHGQPGSAQDWDLVLDALAGRLRTIVPDRPGYGNRLRPGGLARNAAVALAQLDALQVERATVVGLSYGGAVAAWIAAHHPQRVSALVLVSPAANVQSLLRSDRLLALPGLGPLLTATMFAGAGLVSQLPGLRLRVARNRGLSEAYLRSTGRRLLSLRTLASFTIEQGSLLRDLPLLESALSTISAPTQILVGDRDTVVPVAANVQLARQIPGARLTRIAGGGHALCVSDPATVAAAIVTAARG